MPNIFGNTDPPAWLTPIAGENRRLAGQFGREAGLNLAALIRTVSPSNEPKIGFSQAYQEARLNESDPMWRLRKEQADAAILGNVAQAQSAYALLRERNAETAAWAEDAPKAAEYFSATPEKRATMPTPVFKSRQAMTMLERLQIGDMNYNVRKAQAENQSLAAKIAVKDSGDFTKQLDLLSDPANRAQIRSMSPNRDGTPSAMQWQALTTAQEAEKTAAENIRKQAEIEADLRGDVRTTTISEKTGVSTKFAPAPEITGTTRGPVKLELQEIGGKRYVVNPKTGHAFPADKESIDKGVTVQELYKDYVNASTDPLDKKAIQDYVAENFPKQAKLFGVEPVRKAVATSTPASVVTPNPSDPLGLGIKK